MGSRTFSAIAIAATKTREHTHRAVVPCPLATSGSEAAPAPKNPCTGIGMSDAAKQKEYVAEFKKSQGEWPKLTVAQREARLQEIVNKPLTASGGPGGIIESSPLTDGRNGEFDFETRTLRINQDLMESQLLSVRDKRRRSGLLHVGMMNEVADLKNFAIVYDDVQGEARLAPVYDLVTTSVYLLKRHPGPDTQRLYKVADGKGTQEAW
jgi:hypothetical protein